MTLVAPLLPRRGQKPGWAVSIDGVRYWIVRMIDRFRALLRRCQIQQTPPRPKPARKPSPPAPRPVQPPTVPAEPGSLIEALLTAWLAHRSATRTTSRGGHR